jgi:hypothetical protein
MFVINLYTNFHIHTSKGPLVIGVKLQAEWRCSHGYHFVVYILQNLILMNVAYSEIKTF